MMREISKGHETVEGFFERCFKDDLLSLLVWQRADKSIFGFQISYDPADIPRTLTWTEERGFSHAVIDEGESSPLKNRSAMLKPSGDFDAVGLLLGFDSASEEVSVVEREFVRQKLMQAQAWWERRIAQSRQ